jgi:hypothetical protein
MKKEKYDNDALLKYCNENSICLINNYNNLKINRETIIEGKCINGCINIFKKTFRYLKNYGGYCDICTISNKKIKSKNTCLQKYGVENPFENEEIKEKIKVTNVKRYGFENPFENEIVKNKSKQTCLKNYGVAYSMQSEIVKNKSKQTCLKKYGVEHQMLLSETHDKIRQTCLKKYGVENASQVPEIVDTKYKNSYKRKTYIFPSGNQIMCQGYEPFALNKLIKDKLINETDIVTGAKNVPEIWYDDESGKKHRHYVDIFIPSQNRMVEVKSTWTAEKKKDNIFLKQEAGKKLGYLYEIWIYNKKGEIVECHK